MKSVFFENVKDGRFNIEKDRVSLERFALKGMFYLWPLVSHPTAEIDPKETRGGPAVSQKSGAAAR